MNDITLKQILQASGKLLKEHLPAVGQPVSGGYKKRFFEFCHFLVLSIFEFRHRISYSSKLNCILFIRQRKETGKSALFHDRIIIVCLSFHIKTFRKTIADHFAAYSESL